MAMDAAARVAVVPGRRVVFIDCTRKVHLPRLVQTIQVRLQTCSGGRGAGGRVLAGKGAP